MAKQNLKVGEPLGPEGIDENFLIKSMMAYENIVSLLKEAEKKQNLPVLMSNVERLKSIVKYYMKNAQRLDARIKYYQSVNRSLEIENERMAHEKLLLICELKGREPYLRAKNMLDDFFNDK